jgi:CBS domain-containing protein
VMKWVMKIKDVIRTRPQCVSPDATLAEAAGSMKMLDVGFLPICENDRLIGTVTDRDIAIRAVAKGCDPKVTKVREVMSRDLVYCMENQELDEAARLMEEKMVRRLPILDQNKRLVGIVSVGDLAARAHETQLAGEVLERVAANSR